jgi:hypothetical protein
MPRTVPNHSRRAFLELGCITESVFSREKERDCPCSQVIKGTFVSLDIHRKPKAACFLSYVEYRPHANTSNIMKNRLLMREGG